MLTGGSAPPAPGFVFIMETELINIDHRYSEKGQGHKHTHIHTHTHTHTVYRYTYKIGEIGESEIGVSETLVK